MFQKLVSHNDDIRRLVGKGFAVGFDGPHMIVRDIPYLDATRTLQWGAFVAKLVFVDEVRVVQDDHQVYLLEACHTTWMAHLYRILLEEFTNSC